MNNDSIELKRLVVTALFIAFGVVLAPFVAFPFGGARVFPLQHMINVLLVLLVGWRYSVAGAFCISSIRIAMGSGTLLAYPGSMIGAFLSGFIYQRTGSLVGAVLGEIVGTGIIGGLVSYPIMTVILGKTVAVYALVVAFLPNTIIGAIVAAIVYKVLPSAKLKQMMEQ